jgi:heptosyltransferase-3/putative inorganic carbon (HCO3(-)) transporter
LAKTQETGLIVLAFASFFPPLYHFQEYAFFSLLLAAFVFAVRQGAPLWVHTPLDVPLLAFIGWVLCTVPFAADPAYSFSEWRKFIAHVLVYYWAMFVFRGQGHTDLVRKTLLAVVWGSLLLSCFALIDFELHGGTWKHRLVRASAVNSDYNWLSTYLVLALPIVVWWAYTINVFRYRLLSILALAFAGLAQVASYTRAGWIANLVQGITFAILSGSRRLIIAFVAAALVIGASLMVVSQLGYQRDTIDPWTLSARTKTWQLGFRQVMEHPIVGVGYGNDTFVKIYDAEVQAEKGKGAEEKVLPGLHNTYAMVLMGTGVPGLVLFVWILVRAFQRIAFARATRSHAKISFPIESAIALAVLGFMVRNGFDYMFAGSLASLFWILVAAGLSVETHQRSGPEARSVI